MVSARIRPRFQTTQSFISSTIATTNPGVLTCISFPSFVPPKATADVQATSASVPCFHLLAPGHSDRDVPRNILWYGVEKRGGFFFGGGGGGGALKSTV